MESEDGVIAGLSEGKIWLEMSTTDEAEVKRIGALVEEKGAIPLDSPVSGGCHRAATGNIAILVGGDRIGFDKAFPAISVMGKEILHTGPLGSASIMKVITNFLAGVQLLALGEAWAVAKLSGMDLATAFEAIRISSGNSFVHETESQLILNGSYNINFTMDLGLKDMSIFNDFGNRYGVPMEIAPVTLDAIKDGLDRYGPRVWSSMIVKRMEDDCNTDFRAEGFPECLEDDEPPQKGREVKILSKNY
jgi:3-hydroxyisobutyrate dehydrogenase